MPELTFRLEEGPFHDISLYRLHFHMNIMYKEKLCFYSLNSKPSA